MMSSSSRRLRAGAIAVTLLLALCGVAYAYPADQCTGWAHHKRPDLPGNLGNAHSWNENAARAGFPVDSRACPGAIVVWERGQRGAGGHGHVAFVEAVGGGNIRVSEKNWPTGAGLRYRTIPAAGFSYIHRRGRTNCAARPSFGPLKAYAAPTIELTAGGRASIVVTSKYSGPSLACGRLHLRVRGDGSAPSRFVDSASGRWLSYQGVRIEGCNGYLRNGQTALWRLPLTAPLTERPGTYALGRFSPVYEGGFWSSRAISLGLAVKAPWGRLTWIRQSISTPAQGGAEQRAEVVLRNDTGSAITPEMRIRLGTGGPNTERDARFAGGFNRLVLAEACEPGAECTWAASGVVPESAPAGTRRMDLHAVKDSSTSGYHDTFRGIYLTEVVE